MIFESKAVNLISDKTTYPNKGMDKAMFNHLYPTEGFFPCLIKIGKEIKVVNHSEIPQGKSFQVLANNVTWETWDAVCKVQTILKAEVI